MFGRSFDSWRQEGNEWCGLGSQADRKDSIGWERFHRMTMVIMCNPQRRYPKPS